MKFIINPFEYSLRQRNCPTKGPCPMDYCPRLFYIIPVGP